MAARYSLDANICIYALSGRFPALVARIDGLPPGHAVISVVAYGELLYGIQKSRRRDDAERRLSALRRVVTVTPMCGDAGSHYGEIRALLESRGTPIGANDLWIAADALAENLTLVTNNEREFKRVPGLRVENWV